MKKVFISALLIAFSISINAQEIKGDYCELVESTVFGKTYFIVYSEDKMEALVDEKGDKMTSKWGILKGLNIMSERGWEVVSVYDADKAGTKYKTYLLRRKEKK